MIKTTARAIALALEEVGLIEAARAGDAQAFQRLAASSLPRVKRQLRRLLRNEADIDDVVQDALLAAWRGMAGFHGESSFHTWLYRITSNAAFTFLQRAAARPPSTGCEAPESAELETPEGLLEARQRLEILCSTMDALPEKLRRTIELCAIEGRQYRVVAGMIGIPVGTVRSRLHRARSELGLLGD